MADQRKRGGMKQGPVRDRRARSTSQCAPNPQATTKWEVRSVASGTQPNDWCRDRCFPSIFYDPMTKGLRDVQATESVAGNSS